LHEINKNIHRMHCCVSTADLLGELVYMLISDLPKILLALDRPVHVYCPNWGGSVGSLNLVIKCSVKFYLVPLNLW
jgi:hypothetical protein